MIWIETDRELGHVQIRLRHVEELNVLERNLKRADAVSIQVCVHLLICLFKEVFLKVYR